MAFPLKKDSNFKDNFFNTDKNVSKIDRLRSELFKMNENRKLFNCTGEEFEEHKSQITKEIHQQFDDSISSLIVKPNHRLNDENQWKSTLANLNNEEIVSRFNLNGGVVREPMKIDPRIVVNKHDTNIDQMMSNCREKVKQYMSNSEQHQSKVEEFLARNYKRDLIYGQKRNETSKNENVLCVSPQKKKVKGPFTSKYSVKDRRNDDQNDNKDDDDIKTMFRTGLEKLAIDLLKKNEVRSGGLSKKQSGTNQRSNTSTFQPPLRHDDDNENETNNDFDKCSKKKLEIKNVDPIMIERIENEIIDKMDRKIEWDDIAGLELAKEKIIEIVVWPLLRPDLFKGIRKPPKGLMLFGPPGTGKTLIGKCIASQSNSTFFSISSSTLTSKWIGEGEKMVRAMFAVARAKQPSVIFIDEVDSLLSQRNETEHESSRRIKTEFLVQFEGVGTEKDEQLLIIGATNRPNELDEAARRRFSSRLYIPLPECQARKQIIINCLKGEKYDLTEEQLDDLTNKTNGYSGADMTHLCREAAMGPFRCIQNGKIDIKNISFSDIRAISYQDFLDALNIIKASVAEKDLATYIEFNEKFGINCNKKIN